MTNTAFSWCCSLPSFMKVRESSLIGTANKYGCGNAAFFWCRLYVCRAGSHLVLNAWCKLVDFC